MADDFAISELVTLVPGFARAALGAAARGLCYHLELVSHQVLSVSRAVARALIGGVEYSYFHVMKSIDFFSNQVDFKRN